MSVAFSGVLDWLVYDRLPGLHVYIGGAILLSGVIIMSIRHTPPPAVEM